MVSFLQLPVPPTAAPAGGRVAQVARETWKRFFHKFGENDVDNDVNYSHKTTWASNLKTTHWREFKSLEFVQRFAEFHIWVHHLFIHNSY